MMETIFDIEALYDSKETNFEAHEFVTIDELDAPIDPYSEY